LHVLYGSSRVMKTREASTPGVGIRISRHAGLCPARSKLQWMMVCLHTCAVGLTSKRTGMKFRPGCSARLAYCLANPCSSHADSQNCSPRVCRRDSRHQLHHMDDSMASAETTGAAAAGNPGRAAARPRGTWEQTAAHLHFHARVLGLGAQEVIETLAGVLLVKDAQGIKGLVWHPSNVLRGESSGHADDQSRNNLRRSPWSAAAKCWQQM
jgi:hypothetical protein